MSIFSTLYRKLPLDSLVTTNIYLYLLVRGLVKQFDIFLPHEPDFAAFQFLPVQPGIFLDIGANDGLASRSFRKFNKTMPIVALEPNRCHQKALEQCKRSMTGFDYMLIGAGEAEAMMPLFTPVHKGFALTSYTSLSQEEACRNLETYLRIRDIAQRVSFVETKAHIRAIDNFAFRPNFVKIDVEGFEVPVLKGMLRTIEQWRPILMIEYNAHNFAAVFSLLTDRDYEILVYDHQKQVFSRHYEQEPLNFFFVHRSRMNDVDRLLDPVNLKTSHG